MRSLTSPEELIKLPVGTRVITTSTTSRWQGRKMRCGWTKTHSSDEWNFVMLSADLLKEGSVQILEEGDAVPPDLEGEFMDDVEREELEVENRADLGQPNERGRGA